ncbi:MAG: squalene/phytoene synthase family protein [Candidatus Delongbacteria bacterium]
MSAAATNPTLLHPLEPGCAGEPAARAACAALCSHYENFSLASLFLPGRLRPALQSIYAFARFSDDMADEPLDNLAGAELRAARRSRLTHWLALLDGLPGTAVRHPILFALNQDAARHGLPLEECRRLLLAFLADQEPPDYPDDQAVLDYCRNSAAPVGRLLLALNGLRPEGPDYRRLAPLSDAVCAGLQLANFWQDLSRDLPAGRLFVPRSRLARHGLPADPARLQATGAEAAPLLAELADWALELLAAAGPLTRELPGRFALEVRMFAGGGACVAWRSAALGARLLHVRPQVGRGAKLAIALGALWPGSPSRRSQSAILRP